MTPWRVRPGIDFGVGEFEDADELLRADAKARVGQALSRLLNLGDGILGQGMRVLVLITTNELVGRIEFRAFTRPEATAVFGDDVPARGELTLARIVGGGDETADEPEVSTGLYL